MNTFDPHDPIVAPEQLLDPALRSVVRLIDARAGAAGRAAFAERHLEGAQHADLDRELAGDASQPAHGGRHPLPDLAVFARTLGGWGVDEHTPIVVYDDQHGANAAARLWWMLRAVGHGAVWVLDGGYDQAVAAGLPTSSEPFLAAPREPYPVPAAWLLPTLDLGTLFHVRTDPAWRVLDVRAPARFRGEREPIDPVAGHIPGAHNVFFEENLDANGRFLSASALRAKYVALLGDLEPNQLAVHCGSGVTACHTLLALARAGLPGAALYVGSWSEWCRNEHLPHEP
jgi:thiosulfate/3-mercaptopyruvate sulfurtransferase